MALSVLFPSQVHRLLIHRTKRGHSCEDGEKEEARSEQNKMENRPTTQPKNWSPFCASKGIYKEVNMAALQHFPAHYRVLSLLLMAYSIAVHTGLAGSAKGSFLDDLTNPGVGQWPKTQAIKRISKIVVYSGDIVDSVRITYELENTATPITVHHGGPRGYETLSFEIGANEKLVAVYGTRLASPGPWGDQNIVQLSFVVINSSNNVPTTKVYTATGQFGGATEKFDFSWALVAASSYTLQPPGVGVSFLQAIGFSRVLDKAGSFGGV